MSAIIESLTEQARKLSTDERLALVEGILASLHPTDPETDQLWAIEAQDRYDAYQRGEVTARPLEDILAKYRK